MTSGSKKSQRETRRKKAQAKKRRKKIIVWSVVAVVGLGLVGVLLFQPLPEELADVETFPNMGQGHLSAGQSPPDYNSTPATSGAHASAAQCGIYLTEISDEVQVHNLEHGVVVVQYQPDLDETQIALLQGWARTKPGHILLAPRADLTDPVVISSWTRLLRLPGADIETVDVYYEQFVFTGAEVGVPCIFAIDESL